jgi:hypothetical protein
MQDNPMRDHSDPRDPPRREDEDRLVQRAVLAIVLAEHPVQLTIADLGRELSDQPGDFAQRDAIDRAVRDLVGIGLLHRHGEFVLPTRAAAHFDRLERG